MVALAAASSLYPGVVYATRATVPPLAFVTFALVLIGLRLATLRSSEKRVWAAPFIVAAAVIAALAAFNPPLAAKAYPAAISLAAALVFGATLWRPPSLIERFARFRDDDISPAITLYCRNVTIVWTVWLSVNTVIAAILSLPGYDAAWALWTGIVAYLFMGALFAGEMVVRRSVQRRSGEP